MVISPPSATVCAHCGAPLQGKQDCLACLVRGGLAEPGKECVSADSLVFGDFEIERHVDSSLWELGRGAMGVTYRARDTILHRNVALKVIEAPAETRSARGARERFLREARAAAALRHANVASVFQFGASIEADRCFYVMELVEGETLEALVRRDGPLKVELALGIAIQVARALVAAAAHGLIHRDLKPANIMLTPNDAGSDELEAKVIDFGLAKSTAEAVGERDLTHGAFVGTPTFASPEQFAGQAADARSDIYSLGVTLWYALTGEVPRVGQTMEEIRSSQTQVALPVEQLAARKIPLTVTRLLRRTLATDPAERPQSARALLSELELCRTTTAAAPRRRQRLRRAALGLGFFAICAASLTTYLWRRQDATEMRPREKSIAVLPFENLSKDQSNAFFAGGVQDEILSDLARIADLKVISRTSVMKYQSAPQRNVREIAKSLGVSHLVEGSVQGAGDRIRVTAQLIDARTDSHLWADHYDRQVTDVFAIQSEIAQQIAAQLRSKLSPAERSAIAERPTADLKAYELYTEARAISVWDDWQGAGKSLERRVELLEQATQRDPRFALAWCALAKTYCDLTDNSDRPQSELAKKAANAALRLRPDLGEVHRELARSYYYANDFAHAYEELTTALRTLPNDSETFRIAAETDRHRNRWDEALANFQKARELDPGNGEVSYHLGVLYREMRRYDDWERMVAKDAGDHPESDPWSEMALAEIKLDEADPVAAQALLAKVPLTFSPTDEIWRTRFTTALYLRDYDGASRVIAAAPAEFAVGVLDGSPPESWFDGLTARFQGNKSKAEAVFTALRDKLDAAWGDRSRNHSYFLRAARLDAGLGGKRQAIEEARRAVDLMPIAKDSALGPWPARNLALVYAWTGERDLALEQLEIVAKIPAGPTYGELRFDPTWDALRGDPPLREIGRRPRAES